MGGQSDNVTTTEKTIPPKYVQQANKRLLQLANQYLAQGGTKVADFTAAQKEGQQDALSTADNLGGYLSHLQNTSSFLTSPELLSPDSNPYLARSVQAAIRPVTETYQNVVMPGINTGAEQTGQFGGSRQGIAQGLAANALERNVGDISANMYAQAYENGLHVLTQNLAIAPTIANAQFLPANIEMQVGAQQQAQQQAENNKAANDLAVFRGGTAFSNVGQSSTGTAPGPQHGGLQGALGGAAAGAGAAASTGNPYIIGGAAVGGAILGYYS